VQLSRQRPITRTVGRFYAAPAASDPYSSKQAMKECIAKQQSDNSGMSAADAKKACKAQMKGSG